MNYRKVVPTLTIALLALMLVAAPAMGAMDFSADESPNPTYEYDLEKAEHNMAWGASDADALTYEDNDGNNATIDGSVDSDAENPYSFVMTDVETDEFGAFPHGDSASALDADDWSASGDASVASTETADGVDALEVSTSGEVAGESSTATFDNFTIDSDEEKRFLQTGLDVESLDDGATVEIAAVDEDGDKKVATINASADASNDGVIADQTGEGWFFQERLGDMPTEGSGDGDFNNIEEVTVTVSDADASVAIAALNLDKMSQYDLGSELVQNEDDEWESETIREIEEPGAVELESLSTMGSTFDDAVIHELSLPVEQSAADLDSEDVETTFSEDDDNQYPNYYGTAEIHVRNGLADAYDLSYSNVKYYDNQTLGSDRYLEVRYAEDVGDEEFEDIGDEQYTELTSSYDDRGSNVTIDDTVMSGDTSVVSYDLRLTEDEYNAMQSSGDSGGSFWGGNDGGDSGGGSGGLLNWIGAAFATLAGTLAMLRRRATGG